MRRGSIQTFESLARRHSSNMAQFASNRSEFMTSDLNDIEYGRRGGFFMTHKKTALIISAVVVIVIAAGFVGAYIGSIPKEKAYDTMALIDADVGCDQRVVSSKFSLSDAIRPSRYRIELSPIVEDDPISRLRGRVSIEFRYNGSGGLGEIVLNAGKIEVTRTQLVSLMAGSSGDLRKSRRRRRNSEEEEAVGEGNSTVASNQSFYNGSSDVSPETATSDVSDDRAIPTNLTLENRTISNENETDDLAGDLKNQEVDADMTSFHEIKSFGLEDPDTKDLPYSTKTLSSEPALEEMPTSRTMEKITNTEISISRTEYDSEGGFVVFYPESSIESGNYLLEIDYLVPLDGYSILANDSESSEEKKLPVGRLNPTNINHFFPLFDDVRMKARFSLAIPCLKSMHIHSNMPVQNTTMISDEWVLVTFEETPPIAPNNLVVAETRHVEILSDQSHKINIVVMVDKSSQGTAKYIYDMTGPVIRSLTDLFTVNLPIEKLSFIGVNQIEHNAGNLGLITIQESLYNVTDESPKVTKEQALMSLIKLIGQQWLGGLVNMHNSTDAWVLESSLLYLQHHHLQEVNAGLNHSTFLMDVQPGAMEVDGYSVSRSLQSKLNPIHSNSFYIHEVYAMGACLIRMLHGALRQPEFRAGYRSFVSRWAAGGNADVASFWEAMTSNSTEDEHPEGDISLQEVMKLWTEESGYPVVTVTRNYETGSAVVHQARFSYDKLASTSEQLWHIPLTWMSLNNTEESSEPSFKWVKPQVENKLEHVGKPGDNQSWVVFNPTKSGYFRVNYDKDNWNLIAQALRENHEVFSPETRASLVDDVLSLAFVSLVPYSIAFDVIGYLPENEMEPEPWSILLHHTMKLNLVLYDTPVYSSYQEYMIKFLSDLYTKVGSKITEGTRLTRIAHELACIFNYPDYVTWVKKSYAGFEHSRGLPINNDVPSYLHKNLLCAFAKFEHELGWQWWQQKFTNVTNREERISLLSSLACFQVTWMLQAVLNDIVYSKTFEESDALIILESFSNYPAASQTALQFVESNWKNITRRYSKSCKVVSAFLDASSTGFTAEKDVEDFQSFRAKNIESLKKVGYVTALLEAKGNSCVSFLQTSLPDFQTTIANRTSF